MISRSLFTGTIVLLAASLANAGPCRPSSIVSSSTVIASVSETATSSFESETATSTASVDVTQSTTTASSAESQSETDAGTTVTVETTPSASSIETTTTALVDTTTTAAPTTTTTAAATTTTAADITTVDTTTEGTTTTAAATTTSEEPEAVQSIHIYAHGSNDPSLTPLGGTGFTVLSDFEVPDVEYIKFTTDVTSPLFFTLSERTGKVAVGNGANVGKVAGYFPNGLGYSSVLVSDATLGEENGVTPVDCEIVDGAVFKKLQCQFGDKGIAEFWTCAGRLVLVSPGVDFTDNCAGADTAYKLSFIEVSNV